MAPNGLNKYTSMEHMGLSIPLNGEPYLVCDCYALFRLSIYMSKIASLIPVVYHGILSPILNNIGISYSSQIYLRGISRDICQICKYVCYLYNIYMCVSLSIGFFSFPWVFYCWHIQQICSLMSIANNILTMVHPLMSINVHFMGIYEWG